MFWYCLRGLNGAGESAQQLNALGALAEGQVQFLAPTWCLTILYESSPTGFDSIFWSPWALHTNDAKPHMQASILINKIKKTNTILN